MTKKEREFTNVPIYLCEKECYFKRVTNQTLTKFSDKAEKEYDETVKSFVEEVELLSDKQENLEKVIALKEKQVNLIESKEDVTDEEVDKSISLIEEITILTDELNTVKAGLVKLGEDNPSREYSKKVDELLAEKVATLLEGITAKEFLENSDPVDTIKARNLEKYYQLCMVGERESKIKQEIKDDIEDFLKSQREVRS